MAVDVEPMERQYNMESDQQVTAMGEPDNWHVELPDLENAEEVNRFKAELGQHGHIRGTKTLSMYLDKYLRTIGIANDHLHKVKTAVNTVNGVSSPRNRVFDERQKLKSATRRFYNTLPTPMLRKQCELFNVDYDSFESVEDIVQALVDKNVEMAG